MDELDYKTKKTEEILLFTFLIIGIISIIFLCGADFEAKRGFKTIKSNKRIEPQLKITIQAGKSDTLFIYKQD